MGDIEETNLPTWTKLSDSIVSPFVTKITHACSLLLFQNSSSSWNNYITKAQMVFYCYWHHSPISLALTKTLLSTVCDTQMYWGVCTFTHGHRWTCTHTKAGYVLQILFSFSYFKGHYLADLKKLKRKVGSAQLQRLFLTRLTNIHRGLSPQTRHQRVAADHCPDWGGGSSSLGLQRGEACGSLWMAE